jgi:ribosomal protein S18 acetylase RimI-like enzyme
MKIVPFSAGMLPEAAQLLAERHRRDRRAIPELPVRCEETKEAMKSLRAVWEKKEVTGVAAIDGDRVIGYLIGQKAENAVRGRHVWMDVAGHAVASGRSVELYRDMYAEASSSWVEEGYFYHCSVLPASDPAIWNSWFCLGFGHEQVHGILSLENDVPVVEPTGNLGVEIRLATPDDRQKIADVSQWIRTYQAKAPIFGVALPEDAIKVRDGYASLVEDESVDLWIAEKEGRVISFQAYFQTDMESTNMLAPNQCVELGVAATLSEYRGLGVNYTLSGKGLSHAKEKGYLFAMTDWRMTNLQSSRCWPRLGFRPVAYRLSRLIDHRIAWARG